MERPEYGVYGKANIKQTGEYSTLYTTHMSIRLNELFALNNLSKQAREAHKLSSQNVARDILRDDISQLLDIYETLKTPYRGLIGEINIALPYDIINEISSKRKRVANSENSDTLAVIDFFINNAKKVGNFFALPSKEIIEAVSNDITAKQIKIAESTGYIRTIKYEKQKESNVEELFITELTEKIYDFDKTKLEERIEKLRKERCLPFTLQIQHKQADGLKN